MNEALEEFKEKQLYLFISQSLLALWIIKEGRPSVGSHLTRQTPASRLWCMEGRNESCSCFRRAQPQAGCEFGATGGFIFKISPLLSVKLTFPIELCGIWDHYKSIKGIKENKSDPEPIPNFLISFDRKLFSAVCGTKKPCVLDLD